MKTRISSVLLLITLLTAASAIAQKVNVDWDRGTNFNQFHTYAWQPSTHPAKGLWDQRIIDAVNQQLQAKGFKLVDSKPDLWVVYSNSIKKDQQVVGTGYNMGPMWGWGYGWGGPTTTTYQTYTTHEGTLIVDIADANGHQLLWRGSATNSISDNSNKNIKNLNNAVNKLFKNFPPKPGSK
ncbi:MAG: DUF4136 domain-containing protein [Candidatus Korobacteraceae bacterium]